MSKEVKNAGRFRVTFNPNDNLFGTRPSNFSGIEPKDGDTVATMLRKNAAYMQDGMDDYFGVDETNKGNRVLVSDMVKTSDDAAYCDVIYKDYEADNEGEVSAMMQDNISSVIAKSIRMDWNDEPYAVTEDQLKEAESDMARFKEAETMAQPVVAAKDTETSTSLDDNLVSEKEMESGNDFSM